jgi:hypothetical protein
MQRYVIVASHMRSGTHWLIDSIFNNINAIDHGYLNLDRLLWSHPNRISIDQFRQQVKNSRGGIILKTHSLGTYEALERFRAEYDFVKQEILPRSKILYIVRDGRDVMVSLYHYVMKNSPPGPKGFVDFLRSLNTFDAVRENETRIQFYVSHVRSWLGVTSRLIVKYEDLHSQYDQCLAEIAHYLGMDAKPEIRKVRLRKYNMIQRGIRRMLPRLFSTTAVLPRRGGVGEWRLAFDDKAKVFFKEQAGELLCELGYETSLDW